MNLFIAILDCILVALYILIAKERDGASKKLYIACAVLWLMCAIINTGLFISKL